jgi:hypothetical protein
LPFDLVRTVPGVVIARQPEELRHGRPETGAIPLRVNGTEQRAIKPLVIRADAETPPHHPLGLGPTPLTDPDLRCLERRCDDHRFELRLGSIEDGPIAQLHPIEEVATNQPQGFLPPSNAVSRREISKTPDVACHGALQSEVAAGPRQAFLTAGGTPQGTPGIGHGRMNGRLRNRTGRPQGFGPRRSTGALGVQGEVDDELPSRGSTKWVSQSCNLHGAEHGHPDPLIAHARNGRSIGAPVRIEKHNCWRAAPSQE